MSEARYPFLQDSTILESSGVKESMERDWMIWHRDLREIRHVGRLETACRRRKRSRPALFWVIGQPPLRLHSRPRNVHEKTQKMD